MTFVKVRTLSECSFSGDRMLEELLRLSSLFDFYGPLLTEKQQECLRLHLFEDFSFTEIGEELGISRQAVYDNIHRAQRAMEGYEKKLGLVQRYQSERAELAIISQAIEKLRSPDNAGHVDEILKRIAPLLGGASQEDNLDI